MTDNIKYIRNNQEHVLMFLKWLMEKGQVRASEANEFIRENISPDPVHWRELTTTALKALGIIEKEGNTIGTIYRIAPNSADYINKITEILKADAARKTGRA